MKIAVIGTGGVGGYFGGKLALAGNDVTFYARGPHLEAIKRNGLTVKSPTGDFVINPANATNTITEMPVVDLIIMSVKAWQVKDILPMLHHISNEDTIILPLQNGVLAAEEIKQELPEAKVIGGLCKIFSKIDLPGIIKHVGVEPQIIFGTLDNQENASLTGLKNIFDEAGINSVLAADVQVELWKKFIFICTGGLIALTRANYGQLRGNEETRELLKKLMYEIYEVAQKSGVAVEEEYIEHTLRFIDEFPAEATTSMARDIWAGNPSELDYQNGTVIQLAKKFGVATPVNNFVYQCLLPQELAARPAGK